TRLPERERDALERHVGLDALDPLRAGGDQARVAARRDDERLRAERVFHLAAEEIDEADRAPVDPRVEALDRVAPDRARRARDLDVRQESGLLRERASGRADAGRDRAADESSRRADDVEADRR